MTLEQEQRLKQADVQSQAAVFANLVAELHAKGLSGPELLEFGNLLSQQLVLGQAVYALAELHQRLLPSSPTGPVS